MKGPKGANSWILWLNKVDKTFYFCDWFLFKRQCNYSRSKGCKVLNKLCERGIIRAWLRSVSFSSGLTWFWFHSYFHIIFHAENGFFVVPGRKSSGTRFNICWSTKVAALHCSTNVELPVCNMACWMSKLAIQHVERSWIRTEVGCICGTTKVNVLKIAELVFYSFNKCNIAFRLYMLVEKQI